MRSHSPDDSTAQSSFVDEIRASESERKLPIHQHTENRSTGTMKRISPVIDANPSQGKRTRWMLVHASAEACVLQSSGLSFMCRGKHNEARGLFVRALDLLESSNTEPNQHALTVEPVSARDLNTPRDPLRGLNQSIVLVDNDGPTSMSIALRHNVALTFMGEENFAEAKRWFEPALADALSAPISHKYITFSLCLYRGLALCLHKLGDQHGALLNYCQLCHLQIAVFGSNSLNVANTLSAMGRIRFIQNNSDDALQLYEEALRIQQSYYGDNNIAVSNTLNEIGIVLFGEGGAMHEFALRYFAKSLEIRRRLNGRMDKGNAILLFNLGTTYLEAGEEDLTIQLFKEALQVELRNDNCPQELIKLLELLGLVYQRRGELCDALSCFSHAHVVAKNAVLPLVSGRLLNMMGNIHLRRANTPEMMRCFTDASRIFRSIPSHDGVLAISGYGFYCLSKRHPECASVA